MNDLAELDKFAKRYAKSWCSQNPQSVAAFYAENGSLSVKTDRLLSDERRLLRRLEDS
jgi:hypothetical protein